MCPLILLLGETFFDTLQMLKSSVEIIKRCRDSQSRESTYW